MDFFESIRAFGNMSGGNSQKVPGSQGASPEQLRKALTCCFMAGVASTLVASGKGITRSKTLDHD